MVASASFPHTSGTVSRAIRNTAVAGANMYILHDKLLITDGDELLIARTLHADCYKNRLGQICT